MVSSMLIGCIWSSVWAIKRRGLSVIMALLFSCIFWLICTVCSLLFRRIVTDDREPRCRPRLASDVRRSRSSCEQGVLIPHPGTAAHPSVLAWRCCEDDRLALNSIIATLFSLAYRDQLLETSARPVHPRWHRNKSKAIYNMTTSRRR